MLVHTLATRFLVTFASNVEQDATGDPWPLVIDDIHGRPHEVVIEPGERSHIILS